MVSFKLVVFYVIVKKMYDVKIAIKIQTGIFKIPVLNAIPKIIDAMKSASFKYFSAFIVFLL